MAWIKRNLYFVLSLAAGLVLFGVGIFFSLSKKSAADEVASQLEQASSTLDTLINRKPYPSDENVKAAREEQARVLAFKTNVMTRFRPPAVPEKLTLEKFKALLETEISGLERRAERNGVKLPAKYGFSFQDRRKQLDVSEKDAKKLPSLATQVLDIRDICSALFEAKIHELVSIKRSGVFESETGFDFLGRKPVKDDVVGTMAYPYEIVFQAFSTELGMALANLINSPEILTVKWVNIEHGQGAAANPDGTPMAGTGPMQFPGGMDPTIAMRYGMRPGMMPPGLAQRYGLAQPQVAPPPAAASQKKGPILDEKSLRVTLSVDVVRVALPGAVAEKVTKPKPAAPTEEAPAAEAAPAQ